MRKTLAERFRDQREQAGLTQAGLARSIGTTQSTIAQVETGIKSPSLEWLHRAAIAIGCAPCELDDRLAER